MRTCQVLARACDDVFREDLADEFVLQQVWVVHQAQHLK